MREEQSVTMDIEICKDDNRIAPWLSNFINTYQQLSTDNLHLLEQIYSDDIHFCDPMHQLHGFDNLADYFDGLYANLQQCDFVINNVIFNQEQAAIYWTMSFKHPSLNSNKEIKVEGSSLLKTDGKKVNYHRDYIDLGAMLYEHIPLVGRIIKAIKQRASR